MCIWRLDMRSQILVYFDSDTGSLNWFESIFFTFQTKKKIVRIPFGRFEEIIRDKRHDNLEKERNKSNDRDCGENRRIIVQE